MPGLAGRDGHRRLDLDEAREPLGRRVLAVDGLTRPRDAGHPDREVVAEPEQGVVGAAVREGADRAVAPVRVLVRDQRADLVGGDGQLVVVHRPTVGRCTTTEQRLFAAGTA